MKNGIIRKPQNIIDIKIQFCYTFLLNHINSLDQVLNLILELNYENIGPTKAFNVWWLFFLVEKFGKACNLVFFKIKQNTYII